jgi:NAD(P)-dependent dehydrogenase (short-subunit alcohol dehydrogenase family)/acyl dehydratase
MTPSHGNSPRNLRLTEEHIRRFAAASGDRNPLHVDELFARATPFGRCISHGALVGIAGLGSVDKAVLRHTTQVELDFRQPVFPGESYTITCTEAAEESGRVEVMRAGRLATAITVRADRAEPPLPHVSSDTRSSAPASPRHHTLEELAAEKPSISERYSCAVELLSALARDLGADGVPEPLLAWLAAASFTVGMLIPGRDALFARARLSRAAEEADGTVSAAVRMTDARTGLVVVDATLADGAASARMQLHAFARAAPPLPDRSSIGRYLAPSTKLRGQNFLVVGASRGLGAALCGALATQEATVWAMFARCEDRAEQLAGEFGPERVRLLQADAEDLDRTRAALDVVRGEARRLDGVCVCAAPPLYESGLHPDEMEATLRFMHSSVAMALTPLSGALELLSPSGWIVLTSSSALVDPPERWPQLNLAKAALEGAAAYCARHSQARVLVLRPPKMWTDATNTPLGRIGAIPADQVAAAVVSRLTRADPPSGLAVLGPEQLEQQPLRSASASARPT